MVFFIVEVLLCLYFNFFSPTVITQRYKVGLEEMKKAERQLECFHHYNFSEGLLEDLREKK